MRALQAWRVSRARAARRGPNADLRRTGMRATCHMPHATCHMPHATCHVPHATCHVPHVCMYAQDEEGSALNDQYVLNLSPDAPKKW